MSDENKAPENIPAPEMLATDAIYIDRVLGKPENADDDDKVPPFSAAEMRKNLDYRINYGAREITLAINSIGGSAVEAFAIYDMIKECQADGVTFTAECFGIVASSATLISSACDKVISQPSCSWLIHNPAIKTKGTAAALRETASDLESWQKRAADIYATKTGKSAEEIQRVMDADKIMSAEDARAMGLVDEIAGSASTAEMTANTTDLLNAAMSGYNLDSGEAEKISFLKLAMKGACEKIAALRGELKQALDTSGTAEATAAEMRELVDNMTTENAVMKDKLAAVTAERDELNKLKAEGYFTDQLPAGNNGAPKFSSFAEAQNALGYADALRVMTGISK